MYKDCNKRSREHVYRWNQLWVFWPEKLVSPAVMAGAGERVEDEGDCERSGEGEEEREEAEAQADVRPRAFSGDAPA